LLIPFAVRQQPWIDAELVCAAWWLIWIVGLSILLYSGHRVSDDFRPSQPRNWFSPLFENARDYTPDTSWGWGWYLWDGEGCLVLLGILLAIVLLLGAAWFLVEIALPVLGFVIYFLVRGMLGVVVNDRHGCEKSWPRAIAWGTLWATLYTAPLALLVLLLHVLAARSQQAR
jgi:hypothetical protein